MDVGEHIKNMGRRIHPIPQNGYCMILAIQKAIELDLQIEMTPKNIVRKIYREVKNNIHFYSEFVTGQNEKSIMKDVEKYLCMKSICYDMPVVDLILGAATNALNVNISIVQRSNGNVNNRIPTHAEAINKNNIFVIPQRLKPRGRP